MLPPLTITASDLMHPTLPQDWKSHDDPNTGMTYYYHVPTGMTQWEFPISQPSFSKQSIVAPPQQYTPKGTEPKSMDPSKTSKKFIRQDKLNKDYLSMSKEYSDQLQYRDLAGSQTCLLCSSSPSTHILFPCGHKCVCKSCISNHKLCESHVANLGDGLDKWCFCPLCNEEIKKMSLFSGNDEEKYWNWVNEIKPNLPRRFVHTFKESAGSVKRDFGNETEDEAEQEEGARERRGSKQKQSSTACLVS